MIIHLLSQLLLAVLRLLLLPASTIVFPIQVSGVILQIIQYIATGAGVMKTFTDWSYISSLFAFIISLEVFTSAYHVVMWVLKKVPFINIH